MGSGIYSIISLSLFSYSLEVFCGTQTLKLLGVIFRGGGTSFFPVKHEKFPLSYIQDAKNFAVVKPLNSGEALASLASPVPPPLRIYVLSMNSNVRFMLQQISRSH